MINNFASQERKKIEVSKEYIEHALIWCWIPIFCKIHCSVILNLVLVRPWFLFVV